MFTIQKKEYNWLGNYWQPTKEWYEWKDTNIAFDTEEQANEYLQKLLSNPYLLAHRVVHNGKPIAEYFRKNGKVEKKEV